MIANFEYSNFSIEEIKRTYHLNELCQDDTAQKENIALSLKLLHFYCDMLLSQYPRDLEAMICREIIIISYSVLDGLVGCLGFLMQEQCHQCTHRCKYYSVNMYLGESIRKNEEKSFELADKYLKYCKIINLTPAAEIFYREYRSRRNNIHLTKNCDVITKDRCFNREHCKRAIVFLNEFVEMLYENHREFTNQNNCYNRKRR